MSTVEDVLMLVSLSDIWCQVMFTLQGLNMLAFVFLSEFNFVFVSR